MRAAAIAVFFPIMLLIGCGYVGPIVPPSPELPNPIIDLKAVERGDRLVITFSTPPRTTDNLAIKQFSEIDLRVGRAITPWDFERWSAAATPYRLPLPHANDPDDPKPIPMSDSVPVSQWIGKRIAVAVRTAVKKTEHYSSWSNVERLEIVAPLEAPKIEAQATAKGVRLTWPSQGTDLSYRIFRKAPSDKVSIELGTANGSEYLDTTAQFERPYEYTVVAEERSAASLPSAPAEITPIDKFPPTVPASLTALATPESIEVSWQRSPESDLKGYYVYRSVEAGPFVRQGNLINLPAYSDHNVEHGKTYHYAVSAVDQKDNESEKSGVAEVVF